MKFCFIRTKDSVVSYQDLFRMVELSGFTLLKEGDEGTYDVAIKTQYSVHCPVKSKIIVLWYLERPAIDGGVDALRKRLEKGHDFDYVWVSDRKLYEDLSGLEHVHFVPIGSHEGLCAVSEHRPFDVCHLMHPNQRRDGVLRPLSGRLAPCTYDITAKSSLVSQSKFMLNVHQFQDFHIEPLRIALAVSAGIPVISEECLDAYPYTGVGFIEKTYGSIASFVNEALHSPYEEYLKQGLELRERVLDGYSFNKNVLQAIEALKGYLP